MKELSKKIFSIFLVLLIILNFSSCGILDRSIDRDEETASTDGNFKINGAKESLKIVSGSENKELEPLIQDFVKKHKINVDIDYAGSIEIMNMLQGGDLKYDAVWPANSMWISIGDENHLVKHVESTSITPVVLGVKMSKAKELGYVGRKVKVKDLINDINAKKLKFTMTSATQSNSGASAYIGFLYALAGSPTVLSEKDINNKDLQKNLKKLLSGVERSSGSSGWLKDLYIKGNYDAMINYESMVIAANEELVSQKKEPMYVVYLEDGTSLSDSPLGYVDKKDEKKEKAFLTLQDFLLSKEIQDKIQKTGRRTGFEGVSEENKEIFKSEWGLDTETVLAPITMPSKEVLIKALNNYQTSFRKPSLTIYALDFSGSMYGDGSSQLKDAMDFILNQSRAAKELLQANVEEKNYAIIFSSYIIDTYEGRGDNASLNALNKRIQGIEPSGGTNMYKALMDAMDILKKNDLEAYSPAIILMTDGESRTRDKDEFEAMYRQSKLDVPIFSIMFGEANEKQLKNLADISRGKIFDGRDDLISAFKSVKGYN